MTRAWGVHEIGKFIKIFDKIGKNVFYFNQLEHVSMLEQSYLW